MKKIFLQFGFPEELKTDFGPHFRDTFQKWCRRAGIRSNLSSAYNSSANFRAEKQVQDVKKLMQKVKEGKEDWNLAYAEWRNAPSVQGNSPAQLFYGRQVWSCILP